MCGIVAVLMRDGRPADKVVLEKMRDTMSHRGPDGAGTYLDGSVALGHRRLSIVDLSTAGHQPMTNEDQTVWLTFNGEIYNYVELAAELRDRGHVFHSSTDSEVIIHLWEELGPACLDRLNGMFAFVLWDANRQELFGARDRIGIKPFHYYDGADRFIAASEIKAILADPAVPRRPDYEGLSDYLMAGFPSGARTTFAGIRQLEPGWALSVKDGRLRTWSYWDLQYNYNFDRSFDETVEAVSDLLADAVRIHSRSDAALGCHLSGGLDSSTVVALAARHRKPLDTFSISFSGGTFFDERSFAREVSGHIGTTHWEARPGPDDFRALLTSLAWHTDLPMPDHTIFAYHGASRLAAEHVKVSLTGHGGDEIFAGYPKHFQMAFGDQSMFDLTDRPELRVPLLGRARSSLRRHGAVGTLRRALRRSAAKKPDASRQWMALHCGPPPRLNPLLQDDFKRRLGGYDPVESYLAPFHGAPTDQLLDRCLYHDLRWYLPTLLFQEDRASMAVSLESRVPLLDHRIVELLATVPPDIKVRAREPKALLRQAARPWLPANVVDRRDKGAFGVPTGAWFNGPLKGSLEDIILSKRALERGLFNRRELVGDDVTRNTKWTALSVELWFRLFFDEDRESLDLVRSGQAVKGPLWGGTASGLAG